MPTQGVFVDFTATVIPVLKPTSDLKPMEQIKPNYFGGANFEARTVKDIIEPAKGISNKVSVRAALDQMQAQATDSSPVVDQCGELLGILSKNKMNRNVGGFGHDPKTEPVEAHIEKNNAYCFEDQTIAEAEQMMLNAKLGEVSVVTREKLLVGTINIEAIAQEEEIGVASKLRIPKFFARRSGELTRRGRVLAADTPKAFARHGG